MLNVQTEPAASLTIPVALRKWRYEVSPQAVCTYRGVPFMEPTSPNNRTRHKERQSLELHGAKDGRRLGARVRKLDKCTKTVVVVGADNARQQAILARFGIFFFRRGIGALQIVLIVVRA
jgi:hypothetical protein